MKIYLKMGIAVLSIYVLTIAIVYLFQDKLIFQSVKLSSNYKFKFDVPFKEFSRKTADNEQINTLLFKTDSLKPLGLIVYFHGNANNLNRWGKYAVDFTSLGYDVLMVEYRGYGKSTGTPSEELLYSDSKFIWDWAKSNFSYPKWIIYGRSLGAAVATHLATQTNADLLALETPFDDLNGALAARLIPFRLKYSFANKERLGAISCRKIIFHGTRDWIVPLSSALRLKPLIKKDDQFIIIPKGGHRNLTDFKIYHEKLKAFLTE